MALLVWAAFITDSGAQSYTFSTTPDHAYSCIAGLALDPGGDLIATTYYSHFITRSPRAGTYARMAGDHISGAVDGTGTAARFNWPKGIALDQEGNLFIADSGNHAIRKVTQAGVVTTFAGGLGDPAGSTDGTRLSARFSSPVDLAIDQAGNLYVADTGNHTIRKITPDGIVSTLAGSAGAAGSVDGSGVAARFHAPGGIAVDGSGNVFVADTLNHSIRRITPAGVVTTVAGFSGNAGPLDGSGTRARFDNPSAVAVDQDGNLFVADSRNSAIRRISPVGVVTTISAAGALNEVRDLAVDAAGVLYVADQYSIKFGTVSEQVAITRQPQSRTVAAGSALALTVVATGSDPITYQWQKNGAAIPGATSGTLRLAGVQAADSATYTVSATNRHGTVLSTGAVLTVVAALPNNDFAHAQEISGSSGSVTGHNIGATAETGEPTHVRYGATDSSVWYRWTATHTGTQAFSTSSTGYFSLGVYTGSSLENLFHVDQTEGYRRVTFRATEGTVYYIAVGTFYGSERGSFTLDWRLIPNDDFARAEVLAADSGRVTGSISDATVEPDEPDAGGASSVWYRWTPSQSGAASLLLFGLTPVSIYTGDSLGTLAAVETFRDSRSGLVPATVVFPVRAGTTYFLAVRGHYGSFTLEYAVTPEPINFGLSATPTPAVRGAPITFNVTSISSLPLTYQWSWNGAAVAGATGATFVLPKAEPAGTVTCSVTVTNSNGSTTSSVDVNVLTPPANDNFADAVQLAGTSGSVAGTNVNALGEEGEPVHWSFAGTASSVWYKWTAPANGLAVIDTSGSFIDTVLAVYTGGDLRSLTRLVQNDDTPAGRASQVSFAARANTTYSIAIGGSTTWTRGGITVNWQLSPVLEIARAPVSQTIAVGGSATFTVDATGTGLTYQWYRNGTDIPGATTSTLNVSSVSAGDDASYTVAVTNSSGTVMSSAATLAVAAPDLTTLAIRHKAPDTPMLWSIAAGDGTLVAVGDAGVILSSKDGRTWSPRSSGTREWLVGVTHGAGQFVAVGDHGLILTSGDGETWHPVPVSGTLSRLNNVLFAGGKFVAVGEGGTILNSTDGQTWTPCVSGVQAWLHGLAYNPEIRHFAATGQGGTFLYSPDGSTWTRLPVAGVSGDLEAVVAVTSYAQFVAVGADGASIAVHRDEMVLKDGAQLTTWSADVTATGSSARFRSLGAGASALFASGEGGKVITAMDAAGPWLTLPSGTTANLVGGTYINNTLYLVGENQTILQSEPLYASRLINISTLCPVGTDANVLISGFVIGGTSSKRVLVRAAGPALAAAPFGIPGTLSAPVLTLYDASGRALAVSAGWSSAANVEEIATTTAAVGAFPFARGSGDSAILAELDPGSYTAKVEGANNTTGTSILEVYDAGSLADESARAVNLSTRGLAGGDGKKMIAGFVINGASSRRVLIRAVGPRLATAPFHLTGTLSEPRLELYNSRNLLHASAGAWGLQPNADAIRSAGNSVGAFALEDGSRDSAMLVTLLPGTWTVQVSGPGDTAGLVITEVYVLP